MSGLEEISEICFYDSFNSNAPTGLSAFGQPKPIDSTKKVKFIGWPL